MHTPTVKGTAITWQDDDGRRHVLHTDPAECEALRALATGRRHLRALLDSSTAWLEQVTNAGMDRDAALQFLFCRLAAELDVELPEHPDA
jgi:hypothetical protein